MSDERTTPQDAGLRRDSEPGAIRIANLGLVFTELGRTCIALARRVDEIAGAERAALFAQLGSELRDSADLAHDSARFFEGVSRGYPARPAHATTTPGRRSHMKFWQSPWFHTVLHLLGIAGAVVVPTLAASGVGIPAGVVAGAAAVGGFAAKLSQSPLTPRSVEDAVDAAVGK